MSDNTKKTISDAEFEAQLLAGATPSASDGSKRMLIELLQNTFKADDLVKVKNFTKRKTGWVYSNRSLTKIEQVNEFTRRVYQGAQKTRILDAGKTVIVPGWEAYVGLVRFYKQWVQEEGAIGQMNSPAKQAEFVSKAFVGLYDPNEAEPEPDVKAEVEKDLGLSTKPDKNEDLGLKDEKPKAK